MEILKKAARIAAVAAFWLFVWWGVAAVVNRPLLFPDPLTVAKRLCSLMETGAFWQIAAVSLWRILFGVLIAVLLGVLLAAATALFLDGIGFFSHNESSFQVHFYCFLSSLARARWSRAFSLP